MGRTTQSKVLTLDADKKATFTGDLTLSDGSVNITDADNATSLSIINNTITNANALVDISSTTLTTGAMMRINANTAAHNGEILELINAGDTTSTGTGLSVTMPSITTGAAKGISVVMAAATTTARKAGNPAKSSKPNYTQAYTRRVWP